MQIADMTQDCFAAYLAALIDGEGSIEIHPKECGMRLRIGLTTPEVLYAICARLGVGGVREDGSRVEKGHRRLWSYSVNNANDCRVVFKMIEPYMQIKAERLAYALTVIGRMEARMHDLDSRNRAVLAAIASGEQQKVIAARFGISQQGVSRIKVGHTWPSEINKLNARKGLKKFLRPADQIFRLHGEPLVSKCRQPAECDDQSK